MKYLALILAIVFAVLAILAATGFASAVPLLGARFADMLGVDGDHHVKHTIVYAVLALLCLVWMRFSRSAR